MPTPHRVILNAAAPLLLSVSAGVIAQLLGTSLLGHQATVQLAAFALVGAVLAPVTAAVSGGLRGMAPFVAARRDRPAEALPILKDARWLSLVLGVMGAGVMLAVPLIARAGGVSREVTAEFGAAPQLFALQVLPAAAGGASRPIRGRQGSSPSIWTGTVRCRSQASRLRRNRCSTTILPSSACRRRPSGS